MPLATTTASRSSWFLSESDLHVWAVRLDQSFDTVVALERLLTCDERHRADRFVFERDRRRFVVCRAALRTVLGGYLGCNPAALRFSYGDRGKPSLAVNDRAPVQFNVSHAVGVGVVVVGTKPVGVDVERLDRTVDFEALAARFFSREEATEVLSLPREKRREGFFNAWTRKEAYIKAIGDGLACPLHSFAVTLRPGLPAAMRWIDGDDARLWCLRGFSPATGYVAAVATRSSPASLTQKRWSDVTSPCCDLQVFEVSREERQ